MAASVKLIVDSTTDLPPEWLARWDIPVWAAYINFGEESFLDDGVSLAKDEFYRRLAAATELPGTSAPAPGTAAALIRRQLAKAEHVVFFTVASQFSSIYNTVLFAAREIDPKRVTVVDSGQVSMALGWMVAAAAEAAERGANIDDVLAAAQSVRQRLRLWAAINTLEYLQRGGRVNYWLASIGTLFQVKPIIEVQDGTVSTVRRVRTMHKATLTLIDMARECAPLERLAVLHTNFPDGAANVLEKLADIAPPDTITVNVTTAIGTHIGPECVGVALVRKAS
jgi:DegV family protein with EDD domain